MAKNLGFVATIKLEYLNYQLFVTGKHPHYKSILPWFWIYDVFAYNLLVLLALTICVIFPLLFLIPSLLIISILLSPMIAILVLQPYTTALLMVGNCYFKYDYNISNSYLLTSSSGKIEIIVFLLANFLLPLLGYLTLEVISPNLDNSIMFVYLYWGIFCSFIFYKVIHKFYITFMDINKRKILNNQYATL